MHGRHHTFVDTIVGNGAVAFARNGDVLLSLVGPKMATSLAPTALARCMAPESFDTTPSLSAITAARVGRSVCPERFTGDADPLISAHTPASELVPTRTVLMLFSVSSIESSANRSGSHCFARPYA